MKFRRPLKITGRTSSVTNSFGQAITPTADPTVQEMVEALNVLGITVTAHLTPNYPELPELPELR
jgi:hypothetical protein